MVSTSITFSDALVALKITNMVEMSWNHPWLKRVFFSSPLVNLTNSYWTWPFLVDLPVKNGWCSIVMLGFASLPEGMSWNYVQTTVSGKCCEHLFQGRREARAGAHLLFLGFSDSILEGHCDIPRLCVAWNISWDNLSDGFSMNWNLAASRSRENSLHWFKGNLKPVKPSFFVAKPMVSG